METRTSVLFKIIHFAEIFLYYKLSIYCGVQNTTTLFKLYNNKTDIKMLSILPVNILCFITGSYNFIILYQFN